MDNHICVYDFETDGPNPEICQPVQLAALIIDYRTLEIIDKSEFSSFMRPIGIDDPTYYEKNYDTIRWHATNYNPNWETMKETEREDATKKIFDIWNTAPGQKQVFQDFTTYLLKYNTNQSRKGKWSAPLRAGMNIKRFDNVIIDRLCKTYGAITNDGEQKIFTPRDQIDILELAFYWFESLPEPKNYNMLELRRFFGMSGRGAHDALNDVRDEAIMIQKFMRLHRYFAHKVKFKDSMKIE
jgi:hypothetical protein